ncbi:CPA1 family monovalent cation:H+ antiporter [Luteibacter sp. Sphag1AF]|uniref:Na+/H+ antiporter n=1 Tax=Luteibacter sp. Sphag1AF TaxID=2587031 RepID=UPI0017AE5F4B|nr:Na+/H+ antiporter [Luteibacter sp. Sphag1AF]MBB3227936.1 CPA1 family monovalent cation:H+ antiporter [Luteibacter sp. Sphag1AF]
MTALVLLLVVALSGAVVRLLPIKLPLPLVQIGLGAVLAMPMFGMRVQFDPELFFLLFIPPLLFADGWRIPKRELFLLRGPILALAIGLVFFTIVGVGYFVHWMIPTVPLPVAFALAAVLSPTDAVAVTSITGGSRIPSRLLHVLEGEALFNDASGLVALQFAVMAAVTGHFSLADASVDFFIKALGGILAGALVSWVFGHVRRRLVRWSGEGDPSSQVALLLLLPFAAYLLAEHFDVSGILAAVAAGMMMNYTDVLKGGHVATRMQNNSVWSMVEFTFNGIIFLLLGLQLPGVLGNAKLDLAQAGGGHMWYLAGYVVAITLALVLLRFIWVWVSLRFVLLRSLVRHESRPRPGVRLVWTTALAGVRGSITLAGVLSIPLVIREGVPFPVRDLLVFLASGVILCTLIFGAIGLPLLVKGLKLPGEDPRVREEREARALTAQAALRGIEAEVKRIQEDADEDSVALSSQVAARVMSDYQQRMEAAGEEGDVPDKARAEAGTERAIRLAALRAERKELYHLRGTHHINDETLGVLLREVDLAEAALTGLHAG